jgi:hypothetical protein
MGMASAWWMVAPTLLMLLELRAKAWWVLRLLGSGLVGLGVRIMAHNCPVPILVGAS